MQKKVILMILDGWGKSPNPDVSAIAQGNTPFVDGLYNKYSNADLLTDGLNVGLPQGQMGNSEVGHMNLGAGRIVYQDLVKINIAVEEKSLNKEKTVNEAFDFARQNHAAVHFLGLVSDGGVHSHIDHLKGLLEAASEADLQDVYVHAFTDGRDVDPRSGRDFIKDLQSTCNTSGAQIASVIGRYFAMDRDHRWERVKKAYDAMVHGKGLRTENISAALEASYEGGVTDEFIEPIVATNSNNDPLGKIKDGDVVFFFNFRTDRGRELTQVLSQQDMPEQGMHTLDLHYVTMTNYDDTYKGVHIVYEKENIKQTLGEILAQNNMSQIRIAETEKYPHVTFFFNGGREEPYEGEKRILCPSPKVATYDLKPEMSAYEIRDSILPELEKEEAAFICLNFANPDMVGHTGIMSAAIKAVETVDQCAKTIIEKGLEHGYSTIVIADHGNADTMINPDGSPNTAHTTNPVPLILVDTDTPKVTAGVLADIAPTILELLGVEQPELMTGRSLLSKQ